MTTLWLYLTNCILVTRLPLLFRDKSVPFKDVAIESFLQLASLSLLVPSAYVVGLGLTLLVINFLWWWMEKKFQASINQVRVLSLLLILIVLSVFCSRQLGLSFDPSLPAKLARATDYFAPLDILQRFHWNRVHLYLFGMLLCLNEANVIVRMLIDRLDLRPKEPGNPDSLLIVSTAEYQRGRIVGMLERLTLFFLILEGQFSALGFVIAAKTMARFKNLEDRNFAEYFLVGTFLSVVTAGLLALLTRWLLK